jgi:hypothetical protein
MATESPPRAGGAWAWTCSEQPGPDFSSGGRQKNLINNPPRHAKAFQIIIGIQIGLYHAKRSRGVDELDVFFALDRGDDAHMGDLAFLFSGGEKHEVARLEVFHFYFFAH